MGGMGGRRAPAGETRLGVSAAEGFAVLDDPGYARALRMGAWFDQAAAAAGAALEAAGAGLLPGCPCLSARRAIGSPHP